MQDTVVVSFSTGQLGMIICAAIVVLLLPIVFVKILGRAFPPVYTVSHRASGVGGFLLFTIGVIFAESFIALYHFGQGLGEVFHIASMDSSFIWPAVQTLIPDLAAALFLISAAYVLTCKRSTEALYTATAMLWLGGPLTAFLRQYYLGIPFTLDGEPTASFLLTCVLTLYLLFSDRAALTYGTNSGTRLYESRNKQ